MHCCNWIVVSYTGDISFLHSLASWAFSLTVSTMFLIHNEVREDSYTSDHRAVLLWAEHTMHVKPQSQVCFNKAVCLGLADIFVWPYPISSKEKQCCSFAHRPPYLFSKVGCLAHNSKYNKPDILFLFLLRYITQNSDAHHVLCLSVLTVWGVVSRQNKTVGEFYGISAFFICNMVAEFDRSDVASRLLV